MNSVGKGGRNDPADVRQVQRRLNFLSLPPRVRVAEDGRLSPTLIRMIEDFQRRVARIHVVTGKVDPRSPTLVMMNSPMAGQLWQGLDPVAGQAGPRTTMAAMASNGSAEDRRAFEELRRNVIDVGGPPVKAYFAGLDTADRIRPVLRTWTTIRSFGFSAVDSARWYAEILKWPPERSARFFAQMEIPTSPLGRAVKKVLGPGAAVGGKIVMIVDCADKWMDGDYLQVAVEVYKAAVARVMPWAAMIDLIQTMAEAMVPADARASSAFKVLRACDPMGLSSIPVDLVATFAIATVEMVMKGEVDPMRAERLLDRIRSGPGGFFADLGDQLRDQGRDVSVWRQDPSRATRSIGGFAALGL